MVIYKDRYDHCMAALRNKVGLTQTEARAHLMMDAEVPGSVAADLMISMDELWSIKAEADAKVEASGMSEKELYGDRPMLTALISPGRSGARQYN